MEYCLIDAPIISRRRDRRTQNQKRAAEERRLARLDHFLESFTVGDLVAMGFYEQQVKPSPYGIEVWDRSCTVRDEASQGEWEVRRVPTVALCLPFMEKLASIEKMSPSYWEETQTFYWGFKQSRLVGLYCIFDLLNRLVNLPHWTKTPAIPAFWRLGNDNCKNLARDQLTAINEGRFRLKPPSIPPNKRHLTIAQLRHEFTPYDYEWQTGKRARDEAKEYWNQVIKSSN